MNFNKKLIDDYGYAFIKGRFRGTIFEFAIFEYASYYENTGSRSKEYSEWLSTYGE